MRLNRSIPFLLTALLSLVARAEPATEIPFEYSHNLIWIKIVVTGRTEPLNFLLDTGAGSTVLNLQTAGELNLKFGDSEIIQGVNSRSVAKWVRGFDASIASIPIRNSLLAVDLSAPSRACYRRIDGLLGADFLQGRVVRINYAAGKIQLFPNYVTAAPGAQTLPLRKQNDGFCLPVSIAGNKPQWLRLDTGCDEALLWVVSNPDRMKNSARVSIGLAGASGRYATTDVQLGTECFTGVNAGIREKQIFTGEAGLLGNGMLSKFAVTIDMPRKRLILERN